MTKSVTDNEVIKQWLNSGSYIKRVLKKMLYIFLHPYFEELIDRNNQLINKKLLNINILLQEQELTVSNNIYQCLEENKKLTDIINRNTNKIKEAKKLTDITNNKIDEINEVLKEQQIIHKTTEARGVEVEADNKTKLGAIARILQRTHWELIDLKDEMHEGINEELSCILCGHKSIKTEFTTKETECIFGGGHLVRFICPECGCIFGPQKFSRQTITEVSDDYIVHYLGYDENDSTNGEVEAFYMLKPERGKVYLNYGCGKWAHTISVLREQGYIIYGYEPYATDIDNIYIINNIDELKTMKFDGIFSHDLLEHLSNPVAEMKFMKSLLRDNDCKMAHSTACYEYKFEYTRFHTCFYTGNSVEKLAEKTDLIIIDYKDDGEAKFFICYVFGIKTT